MSAQKTPWKRLSPPVNYAASRNEMAAAIRSEAWAPGRRVETVESRIARLLDVPPEWVVATDSCTTALAAAGRLLSPGSGRYADDGSRCVRVCPLTWPSTYSWATECTWVDCDEDGWPLEEVDVGVDLWGRSFRDLDTDPAPSIIDAAHRFGDEDHGAWLRSGEIKAVTYSFAPQKEVSCFNGGALVSPRAGDVRTWLASGSRDRVYGGSGGVKGLLSNVAAAFIKPQLDAAELDRLRAKRRAVLQAYEYYLGPRVLTPAASSSGHLCVVRAESPALRRLWRDALTKKRIEWGHHYPLNEEQRDACPQAAALSDTIISLPCHHAMNEYGAKQVCKVLLRC